MISRVGTSENGFTNAVLKRGIAYRSLEPASIYEKILEPSTLSPDDNIVSRCFLLLIIKFRVFNLPSPPTYLKFTISIPLFSIYLIISVFVKSRGNLSRYTVRGLGFNDVSISFINQINNKKFNINFGL
jgi:hypothetical protein